MLQLLIYIMYLLLMRESNLYIIGSNLVNRQEAHVVVFYRESS